MSTLWDVRYAQRTQRIKASTIRELLKIAEAPGVISFAGGLPAPEVFPVDEIEQACSRVLRENGARALQYGTTEGILSLRELIANSISKLDVEINANNVLITSGSQQALDLLGMVFVNPGDHILVESPTYMGALQALNAYGAEYFAVPSDENGINTDHLEEALRCGPKFIYILPNFQNPTGTTIPLQRRKTLIELADKYGVPIIEDDPYGRLRFEGSHIPSLTSLDAKYRGDAGCYTGNVIYLGTFSKILTPGMRLAWIVAPEQVISKLAIAKQGVDLHTSTFTQYIAYEVGKTGFLDKHVEKIIEVYRERRNVMLDALEEHMPQGIRWTTPKGGLFLWVTLPEQIDTAEMLPLAVEQKVAYVPGESFHPNGGGKNTMRLNFSMATPEKINEGIASLGLVLKKNWKK